jgi:hypothetical protein
MSNLTAKRRNAMPASTFGLPSVRKYPMPDKGHAANAKARATQQVAAGNLSPGAKAKIDAKANKILHHAEAGGLPEHARHGKGKRGST